MRRGRKGRANPSVEAKSGCAEGQESAGEPLREGEKRVRGGVELLGRTPPPRRKTAMRRGRKVQANPSAEAENGDAEGLKRTGDPLCRGEKRRCGGAGKDGRTPP